MCVHSADSLLKLRETAVLSFREAECYGNGGRVAGPCSGGDRLSLEWPHLSFSVSESLNWMPTGPAAGTARRPALYWLWGHTPAASGQEAAPVFADCDNSLCQVPQIRTKQTENRGDGAPGPYAQEWGKNTSAQVELSSAVTCPLAAVEKVIIRKKKNLWCFSGARATCQASWQMLTH